MVVKGSTTAEFEAYLKHFLVPELEEGQVMVMERLPAHEPKRVRELIEELRALIFALLLARLRSYREGLLRDQGDSK